METSNPRIDVDLDRWLTDVEAAARSGNWAQAINWAEQALRLGLRHARLFHFRALGHERAGRLAQAIADLQTAYALDADDPGIANALGSVLTRAGRLLDAINILQGEAQNRPELPETWFNLGVARLAAGDIGGGRADFEQAVTLRPDFSQALGRLAVLAAHRGDGEAALALAARALAVNQINADARRAKIEAYLLEKRALDAELAAMDWLQTSDLGLNARSHAYGLLGDALEAQRRPKDAFKAYSESKAAFAQAHSTKFRALDREPLATTLTTLKREFSAVPQARWQNRTATDEALTCPRIHIFLMGFMRSGTTLLEQSLSRHPEVVSLEETEALADAGAGWLGTPGGLGKIAEADPATMDEWRAAYWSAVRRAGVDPAGKVFIDKLPFNGIKLPLIARLFPEARIIFAVRDPRDVVLSCFQKRLQPNGFSYEMRTLEGAARFYAAYMSLVAAYRESLPLAVLEHRHEALLADFRGAVERVCTFIGLDFRPEMANFKTAALSGDVMSQTSSQLRRGLNANGLDRWRSYAVEMAPVEAALEPWVQAFGYGGENG